MPVQAIRQVTMTTAALALLSLGASAQDAPNVTLCRELQEQYVKLARANEERDLAGILAMRTPDFAAVGPKGRRSTFADMEQYSRRLVETIRPPIKLQNTILTMSLERDTAVVEVLQEFSRRQMVGETERTLDTSVIQRESWRRTPDGWRLAFVEDVHDRRWFVDGKRVDPDTPYDPEAPEFKPVDPPRPEKTTDCGLPKPTS